MNRVDTLWDAIANGSETDIEPHTREEHYLAKAAGIYDGDTPSPRTVKEHYLSTISEGGGTVDSSYNPIEVMFQDMDNSPASEVLSVSGKGGVGDIAMVFVLRKNQEIVSGPGSDWTLLLSNSISPDTDTTRTVNVWYKELTEEAYNFSVTVDVQSSSAKIYTFTFSNAGIPEHIESNDASDVSTGDGDLYQFSTRKPGMTYVWVLNSTYSYTVYGFEPSDPDIGVFPPCDGGIAETLTLLFDGRMNRTTYSVGYSGTEQKSNICCIRIPNKQGPGLLSYSGASIRFCDFSSETENAIPIVAVVGTCNKLSEYQFYNSQVREIVFEYSGPTYISKYAFSYCKNLVMEKMPDTVNIVENSAFKGCSELGMRELSKNLTQIGADVFMSSYILFTEIPVGVEKITDNCFQDSTGLTELSCPGVKLVAPNSSTGTRYYPFKNSGIKKITIGSVGHKVTGMGTYVFSECDDLTEINIYVEDINSLPDFAENSPWGATNATISYLQA